MEADIIKYLKEKYNPDVIILHGSRARGKERPHSDWDFIFLYEDSSRLVSGRDYISNQNIEYSSHSIPVRDIFATFSIKLQDAKVVYETGTFGTELLSRATEIYAQEINWSEEKMKNHSLWFQGRIEGMEDSISDPLLYMKYYVDLYDSVFDYWYWIRNKSYPLPIYVAVDEISKKDPTYFELLRQTADISLSPQEQVEVFREIYRSLFRS